MCQIKLSDAEVFSTTHESGEPRRKRIGRPTIVRRNRVRLPEMEPQRHRDTKGVFKGEVTRHLPAGKIPPEMVYDLVQETYFAILRSSR